MNKQHLHDLYQIKAGSEIYITCGEKVLMFQRGKDSPMFPGAWVGPGGHVDHDEDFLKAAIREVFEETGVIVSAENVRLKALVIHRRPQRNETWILTVFLTDISEEQLINNSHEGTAHWLNKNDLFNMENVFPSAKYYFDHILNDKAGIMYTNLEWGNEGLFNESSVTLDTNY